MTSKVWTWVLGVGAALVAVLAGLLAMLTRRRPPSPPEPPNDLQALRDEHRAESIAARELEHAEEQAEVADALAEDDRRERLRRLRGLDRG